MSIAAELKGILNTDIESLETFRPADPSNFCIWLDLIVGEKGEEGADTFTIQVCTADYLKQQILDQKPLALRGYLLVQYYDYPVIESRINEIVNSISAKTWVEYAMILSRYAYWEFEGER